MPAAVSRGVLASEMRSETAGSFVALAGLSAVIAYVRVAFRPYTDPLLLDLWTLATGATLLVWLAALVGFAWRRPDDAETLRLWAPIGRTVMMAVNACIIVAVWLLMPTAPGDLRLLMILLCFGFVALQIAFATQATQVAVPAVLGILGSVIAVVLIAGGRYALPTALFLGLIGAMLLMLRRLIRASVVAATAARLASEQASARLREALAVVAAERDARTRFIRSASHDLAQPLQAARLFFDQHLTSRDPAERERAAAGVARAFASTAALLDAMLMHLKLDAGAVRSLPEVIGADDFLAQLAFDLGPAAREAGVRLRLPRSGVAVVADPQLLKRVLGNLVINGLRHSKGESLLVAARRAGPDRVRFWVLDDGEGVDPAVAPHLFEDFAQGDRSVARGGFGLGLASARKLAEAMGGSAGHDPRWRSGAAFWVELPRATASPASVGIAA
jgi:signal transduction histidine kinase